MYNIVLVNTSGFVYGGSVTEAAVVLDDLTGGSHTRTAPGHRVKVITISRNREHTHAQHLVTGSLSLQYAKTGNTHTHSTWSQCQGHYNMQKQGTHTRTAPGHRVIVITICRNREHIHA